MTQQRIEIEQLLQSSTGEPKHVVNLRGTDGEIVTYTVDDAVWERLEELKALRKRKFSTRR